MNTRSLALVAAALIAYGAPVARAATPARYCRIVTDAANDQSPIEDGRTVVGDEPEYDVVSGDVASDRTRMTVVIRLRSLPPRVGADYEAIFALGEQAFETGIRIGPDTTSANLSTYDVGSTGHTASGTALPAPAFVVDAAHREVRLTFPLASLAPYASTRSGRTLLVWRMVSYVLVGSGRPGGNVGPAPVFFGLAYGVDLATNGGRSYRLGAPSCVRVGR